MQNSALHFVLLFSPLKYRQKNDIGLPSVEIRNAINRYFHTSTAKRRCGCFHPPQLLTQMFDLVTTLTLTPRPSKRNQFT